MLSLSKKVMSKPEGHPKSRVIIAGREKVSDFRIASHFILKNLPFA